MPFDSTNVQNLTANPAVGTVFKWRGEVKREKKQNKGKHIDGRVRNKKERPQTSTSIYTKRARDLGAWREEEKEEQEERLSPYWIKILSHQKKPFMKQRSKSMEKRRQMRRRY